MRENQFDGVYVTYFHVFFMGILLAATLLNIFRYVFKKEKESLYFSYYTLSLFVFYLLVCSAFPGLNFLRFNDMRINHLIKSNQINLTFIFYFYFASVFLDGKNRYPKLNRIIITAVNINIMLWLVGTMMLFIMPGSLLSRLLQYAVFAIIIAMALVATMAITRNWSYLERFFIMGTSALIFSGLYSLVNPILGAFGRPAIPLMSHSDMVLMLCILIQLFTYGIAIGIKTRKEKNKFVSLEKFWIRELETNRNLQEQLRLSMLRYQEQLEIEVKERSEEIIRRNGELQEARMNKTLEKYKRLAVESELKALRTQINPHFLFNCMNILSSFIIRDLKDEALNFILKFSKLMRLVLENSRHHEVPVEKDLEALRLYVQLEAIRYDFSFEYDFDVDPALYQDHHIPPMLLQPYVENAIRHGLSNKTSGKRLLVVKLSLEENHIVCRITDNGVGREKAALLKAESNEKPHESIGMKVTESRIALLDGLSQGKASVEIHDLAGDQTGTVIKIILPLT